MQEISKINTLKILKSEQILERFKTSRQSLCNDPYRPIYHYSTPENLMNDPNGLCEWNGQYHLFYQLKPTNEDRWHWGHTVSTDLIHWKDLPPAIYPDIEKDCFSGQTLVEKNRVIAIYHGTQSGNSISISSDKMLENWEGLSNNPVIPIVPIDNNGLPYRVFDPCIWKENDGYYSISGVYKNGERSVDCIGVNHLFHSKNLQNWKHIGELFESSFFTEPGEDIAVPNFLPISNDEYIVLFFSHKRGAQYFIGEYNPSKHIFTPRTHGRMTYGPLSIGSLHAPSATIDTSGRLISIYNVKEGKPSNWQDVMSLPRKLSLGSNSHLKITPVEETHSLRLSKKELSGITVNPNQEILLNDIGGKSIEIEAKINLATSREAGFYVLQSKDGTEKTKISLLRTSNTPYKWSEKDSLQIDVSEASKDPNMYARTPEIGPVKLINDTILNLRIFIDQSIIEVFANNEQCLTLRSYPTQKDSRYISFFAKGGVAEILNMKVWQMKSIWPELKFKENK